MKHFKKVMQEVGPSITPEIRENYIEFEKQFRKKRGKEMQSDIKRSYLG